MLEAILQRVPSMDLLNCRQVNHQWNEIASGIHRRRADITLNFRFIGGQFIQPVAIRDDVTEMGEKTFKWTTKTLTDLVALLKNSEHFPFTSFAFCSLKNFENEDMRNFLSVWGENILALNVSLTGPKRNVEILRDLILARIPNLKKLEIQYMRTDFNFWYNFPIYSELFADKVQLPKLEVLIVNSQYMKSRGFLQDLLTAACNLKKFSFNDSIEDGTLNQLRCVQKTITTEEMAWLQSLNKLQCLSNLQICFTEDFINYWPSSYNH